MRVFCPRTQHVDLPGLEPGPLDPGPLDPGPLDPGPLDPEPLDPGPLDPESSAMSIKPPRLLLIL